MVFPNATIPPPQEFQYFPPAEAVKKWFMDPEFVAARASARVMTPGSFWGSKEMQRLEQVTGGAINGSDCSICELGFDSAELFHFAQHSTGLIFIRWVFLHE